MRASWTRRYAERMLLLLIWNSNGNIVGWYPGRIVSQIAWNELSVCVFVCRSYLCSCCPIKLDWGLSWLMIVLINLQRLTHKWFRVVEEVAVRTEQGIKGRTVMDSFGYPRLFFRKYTIIKLLLCTIINRCHFYWFNQESRYFILIWIKCLCAAKVLF